MRKRIARHLIKIATRLDPDLPLVYQTNQVMTEAGAKALLALVNHELGGRVGLGFRRVDGTDGIAKH